MKFPEAQLAEEGQQAADMEANFLQSLHETRTLEAQLLDALPEVRLTACLSCAFTQSSINVMWCRADGYNHASISLDCPAAACHAIQQHEQSSR